MRLDPEERILEKFKEISTECLPTNMDVIPTFDDTDLYFGFGKMKPGEGRMGFTRLNKEK